jgi:hypothetical protein
MWIKIPIEFYNYRVSTRGCGHGILLTTVNRGSVNRDTEADILVHMINLTQISVNLTAVKQGYQVQKNWKIKEKFGHKQFHKGQIFDDIVQNNYNYF